MKIYTKTGDGGKTSLLGGQRVSKADLRLDAYGTVDELNAILGVVVGSEAKLQATIEPIQEHLMILGAHLANPDKSTSTAHDLPEFNEAMVTNLERQIDQLDQALPDLKNFILPGGDPAAARLQVARTVCRRAERVVAKLAAETTVAPVLLAYLNRLSDFLFVLARFTNQQAGVKDQPWKP